MKLEKVYLDIEKTFGKLVLLAILPNETVPDRNRRMRVKYKKVRLFSEKQPNGTLEVCLPSDFILTVFQTGDAVVLRNAVLDPKVKNSNGFVSVEYNLIAESMEKRVK